MSRALNGPIPGQSLTDEPSNYAWERPPETADPTEALSMHLKKMAGPKYMDSALYMMELGVPADVITNTTLTMAIGVFFNLDFLNTLINFEVLVKLSA